MPLIKVAQVDQIKTKIDMVPQKLL